MKNGKIDQLQFQSPTENSLQLIMESNGKEIREK